MNKTSERIAELEGWLEIAAEDIVFSALRASERITELEAQLEAENSAWEDCYNKQRDRANKSEVATSQVRRELEQAKTESRQWKADCRKAQADLTAYLSLPVTVAESASVLLDAVERDANNCAHTLRNQPLGGFGGLKKSLRTLSHEATKAALTKVKGN